MIAKVAVLVIKAYQLGVSPWLRPSCRFFPSCSEYAVQALQRHGVVRGGWLVLRRLAKCQPFHPGGVDQVPMAAKSAACNAQRGPRS